jgi:ribosomal protein S1
MKFSQIKTLAVVLVLAAATAALAHDGGTHVKGVVTAIGENTITIQTPDKQTKVIAFDENTKFQKANAAVTVKDLQVGSRVVIDVHEIENKLHAGVVRIGAAKRKTGASAHAHKEKQ